MAHTRTRRLFKRKLHLHSYMYMDKTSQGRNASSCMMIAAPLRCQAFLALRSPSIRSFSATRTSDCNRSQPHWLHSFPGRLLLALSQLLQTSLVPRQTSPTRTHAGTHARMYARMYARKCSRHHDSLGLAQARPNKPVNLRFILSMSQLYTSAYWLHQYHNNTSRVELWVELHANPCILSDIYFTNTML